MPQNSKVWPSHQNEDRGSSYYYEFSKLILVKIGFLGVFIDNSRSKVSQTQQYSNYDALGISVGIS